VPLIVTIFTDDVLPILAVAAVGFVLARRMGVSPQGLSRVTVNALVPCLVFTSLIASHLSSDEFARLALFTTLLILARGALAKLCAWGLRLDQATAAGFLLVIMFTNTGNYGLSVAALAFGADALARATIIYVCAAVLTYTVGVAVAAGGDRTPKELAAEVIRVPMIYAALGAAAVLVSGVTLPVAVMRPLQLMANAALPSMMLIMGMQLAQTRRVENVRLIAIATGMSLIVAPLLGFGISALLGLDMASQQAAILQAGMPGAVATTVLAVEYGASPALVTSAVFVATVLSPLTVTPLIALLQ
jgi:malate permease and related proteins